MKIQKIREDESLAMWRARIADTFHLDHQMQEILREVSVTSYAEGASAERVINEKLKELFK